MFPKWGFERLEPVTKIQNEVITLLPPALEKTFIFEPISKSSPPAAPQMGLSPHVFENGFTYHSPLESNMIQKRCVAC